MTIRKRLIFSYIAMLLIPLFLIVTANGIIRYFSSLAEGTNSSLFSNNRYMHFPESYVEIISGINQILLYSPKTLISQEYMNQLEANLNLPGGFIIIQDEIIKYKSSWMSEQTVLETIDNTSARLNTIKPGKHLGADVLFQWEFSIPGESNSNFYYILDRRQMFNEYFIKGLLFTITIAIILVFTNGLLTIMVLRSIISPLKELKNAAIRIKDGDLDNPVTARTKDEMADVFASFDEMRIRLKKSLELQISYEENRKELIASISHDLRTPLTVLKGYVEGLKDGIANTDEKKDHYLDTIHQKARQMDRLIDDLFLFSRLELNNYPFNPVPLELETWLKEALADLSVDYPEIIFKTEFSTNPTVAADPTELFRVLSNIVQNSSHYSENSNLIVTITLNSSVDSAELILTDNGVGISADHIQYIFDRFYQTDESRNHNSKGSGLGLSITKMIINHHGGIVSALSSPGNGLSIIIKLPLLSSIEKKDSSEVENE